MIDESAAIATFIEELIKCVNWARPSLQLRMTSLAAGISYNAYKIEDGYLLPAKSIIQLKELTNCHMAVLEQYFTMLTNNKVDFVLPEDAVRWEQYQMKKQLPDNSGSLTREQLSSHLIASVRSQHKSRVNRSSYFVRY